MTDFAIEAQGLSFAYPDETPVWGNLSWQVERGAFALLVGPTGCGKTTLLRTLKPEIAPTGNLQGEVRVNGFVGYVAQSPENQLVCDSVWHQLAFGLENVGTPQDVMRRRVAEVAHFFGIAPWFHRAVADLSGGQKQLLNLASVLAMQPSVLLLDEPTAQLDPVAEKNFLHALFRINRELGITVVVATHAPEVMADYATCAYRFASDGAGLRLADVSVYEFRYTAKPCAARQAKGFSENAIAFSDVHVRYARTEPWVLRSFDLVVKRGSIHALVGGNGCGKSTLLNVVAGTLRTDRGRVKNTLRSSQVLLPQDPKALFVCDTVLEELSEWKSSCGYSDADIRDAAATVLGPKANPETVESLLRRHPYDLSGGQQQLLALAKLSLTGAELYLLDEPTKGLDPQSKCYVAGRIRDLAKNGATILFATHDLSFAKLVADEATMVFDGQAVCTEPAPQFFENNLFYRPQPDAFAELWLAQG